MLIPCDILLKCRSLEASELFAGGWLNALVYVLLISNAGVWKSWRSTATITLEPEIGSLAQIKDVISLVAVICKHGVDLALFFPNCLSQIISDWVT